MSHQAPGVARLRHAPPRVWRDVLVQTGRDLWTSNAMEWAASLAFYAVLSLFPLLLVGMVAASYLVDVEWATRQAVDLLGRYLPDGERTLEEIVQEALAQRRQVGIVSIVVFLFTGRRILGGLTKGLNLVSDVNMHDDTVRRRVLVELAMAVGLALLAMLAIASPRLASLSSEALQRLPGPGETYTAIASAAVHVTLLLAIFTMVYTWVPQGERRWPAVLVGAVTATALFLVAQGVFSLLIDSLWENLSLVYGPVAFAVLLLTWAWYVGLVTLAGGAVASHVKVMVLEGESAGTARTRHVNAAT